MKAKIKTKRQDIGGMQIPVLHGHTKITLRDAKTGEITDVAEKDNLVTNAVADIFANNLYGSMNYSEITPVRDMLGGVLCFEDELDELASNTMPPSQADNKLIAHAGQTAHSSASTKRGNPNGTLSEVIQNGKGYKFVWDFSTSQGNGTISSVALTNKVGGDVGLTPIGLIADSPLIAFNSNKTRVLKAGTAIDYATYYNCLVKVDFANAAGIHAELPSRSGSDLIVNEVEISMKKQGINDLLGDARLILSHSITLSRSFDRRYSAICCDDDYLYVCEPNANAGNTLYVDKVSLSNWSVSSVTITDASLSLRMEQTFRNIDHAYPCRTVISGGYLYWMKSDKRGFYKINLTNTADIVEFDSLMEEDTNEEYGLIEISEGLIVGKNFFINDKVYPMATEAASKVMTFDTFSTPFVRGVKDGGLFFLWSYLWSDLYPHTNYAGVMFPRVYLGTIQNLQTPIVKTPDKTMQIEYSVTLAQT